MDAAAPTVTSTTADAAGGGGATDKVLAQLTELQASVAKLASDQTTAVPASDPTHSKLQKQGTLFKMSDISVDVDGDGKVSEDEQQVHEWLKSMAGPDGKIRSREFYGMMTKVADQQKKKRQRRNQKRLMQIQTSHNIFIALY